MGGAPAPWTPHREIAETIGQAVAAAVKSAVGVHVDLGIASSCDPEEMLTGRPLPLHVIVVRMGRPLRDVMIFVSSLKEDVVRPLVEVATRSTLEALDVPTGSDANGALGSYVIDDAIEYTSLDEALEECDALYLESIYSLELPTGELQMVIGTGLLESASYLAQGLADPNAEGTAWQPTSTPDVDAASGSEAAPSIAVDEDEFAAASAQQSSDAPDLSDAPSAVPAAAPAGALDALDAELAAQEQLEEELAPVPGVSASAIAQSPIVDVASTQWTDLLSGVEVELSAELGRADLPLGDITSLNDESVLTLDQLVHDPVTVYVNGTPYATARLVVVDGEYGIEIIEVVDQGHLASRLAA